MITKIESLPFGPMRAVLALRMTVTSHGDAIQVSARTVFGPWVPVVKVTNRPTDPKAMNDIIEQVVAAVVSFDGQMSAAHRETLFGEVRTMYYRMSV